jgi:hypothetical protein
MIWILAPAALITAVEVQVEESDMEINVEIQSCDDERRRPPPDHDEPRLGEREKMPP